MTNSEYERGFADGQKKTAVQMAQSALKVEKKLRKKIEKLQNTIDYLKTCVSCVDYDCQRKRCILKDEVCKNFNKWRMPE